MGATSTPGSYSGFQNTPTVQTGTPELLPTLTTELTGTLPLQQASLSNPPEFPSDLLYLSGGKLMQWDHLKGRRVSFMDQFESSNPAGKTSSYGPRAQVVDYSSDSSQRWIAVLISKGMTANGIDLFDIDLLDLESSKQAKLAENTPGGTQINLSPDGRWLTYLTKGDPQHIQLIPVSPGLESLELGTCLPVGVAVCEAPSWSPDSRKILWSDRNSIWYYETGNQQAISLLGNRLSVWDASGEAQELPVEYHQLVWSPKGRYTTVLVQSRAIDRSWAALFDSRSGRIVEIPDTYKASDPSSTVAWLDDGRLFAAFAAKNDGIPAHLRIWKVYPAHEDILLLDETIPLNSINITNSTSGLLAQDISSIDHVTPVNPRTICMVIRFNGAGNPPTLYCLDLKYKLLQRIGEVPHDLVDLPFSPDGNSVIMTGSHGSTLYASKDQDVLLDLLPLLGDQSSEIIWLNRSLAGKPNQ